MDWAYFDALRKDIERFRGRVRRLETKLQALEDRRGPQADGFVYKALGDGRVVLGALSDAFERLLRQAEDASDPKVLNALERLRDKHERWDLFLRDPRRYAEESRVRYGSEVGTPADILARLWVDSREAADAIREAANAVFYYGGR